MSESGDLVQLRGETWLVASTRRYETCTVLTLEGRGHRNAGCRWAAIEPFDRPVTNRPARPRRRRRPCVLRTALRAMAGARPARGIWTAARARLDLMPFQLEPALAVLNGATRVLLADDVGLGKTVEAGLILCELQARGLADRTLILTPPGLREVWAAELRERFDLQPVVLDQAALADAVARLPADINPWAAHEIVIASIDLVKRPEVLAAVDQASFDLLVADEAHHLTPGSDRGAAVERLASRCPWVVLASATPHSGDDAAFEYLSRLGERGDELVIFRRTRSEVGHGAGRRTHLLPVTPSAAERRMLHATESYSRAIWSGRGLHHEGARLLSIVLARRAASSAVALERTLTRRLHLLAGRAQVMPPHPSLPWEEADDADGDAADELLGLRGLDDPADEARVIEDLIALAREARRRSSKAHRIDRLLRLAREPAVVFTEYRDTLDALALALSPGRRLGALHGGLPHSERRQSIGAFNGGDLDLLIATDAAGEGLSLHHRCRLVIDVELPWNPVRLEQRFGRVDRLGQKRRVHAVRLVHRDTIEETVLARLERRRWRARRGLKGSSSAWVTEDDVAAAALGLRAPSPRDPPSIVTAPAGAGVAECERLARHRAVAPRGSDALALGAVWHPPRHRARPSTQLVAVFCLEHRWASGRTAQEVSRALLVSLHRTPGDADEWQRVVNHLDVHSAVRRSLQHELAVESTGLERDVAEFRTTVGRRLQHIRRHLRERSTRHVQPSLFDRRVERSTGVRAQAMARADAILCGRGDAIASVSTCAPRARLVAVWPVDG